MKNFIRKHKILVVVLAAIGAIWAFPLATAVLGNLHARYAVARGNYWLYGNGGSTAWRKDYARLLQERYGIRCNSTSGCMAFDFDRSYTQAYDAITKAAVIRRYGYDVFAECQADAREAWKQKWAASEATKTQ